MSSSETWPDAFKRRLEDGTAWTTGWTREEIELPSAPILVTVHQYQGPTMQFSTIEEYAEWLFSDPDNPDHAVDLHEEWASPEEQARGHAYLDRRAEELGL